MTDFFWNDPTGGDCCDDEGCCGGGGCCGG